MKRTEYKELIKEALISALKEDKLPWVKEWSCSRTPWASYNYVSNKRYKGANRFWLEIVTESKGYQTNAWLTFNQVKSAGWQLKDAKGEGQPVSFWYPFDTKNKKSITWEEYYRLLSSEKKEDKDLMKKVAIFEKVYYVFNARHVVVDEGTGKTLEELIIEKTPKKEHKEEDVLLADTVLNQYCEAEGIKIVHGGDVASYSPIMDEINLPCKENFSADSFYVKTKAHECSHSTGHEKRLDRGLTGNFHSDNYAVEELRAEISAAFLSADFGLPQLEKAVENSKAYIQAWIEGLQDKAR